MIIYATSRLSEAELVKWRREIKATIILPQSNVPELITNELFSYQWENSFIVSQ